MPAPDGRLEGHSSTNMSASCTSKRMRSPACEHCSWALSLPVPPPDPGNTENAAAAKLFAPAAQVDADEQTPGKGDTGVGDRCSPSASHLSCRGCDGSAESALLPNATEGRRLRRCCGIGSGNADELISAGTRVVCFRPRSAAAICSRSCSFSCRSSRQRLSSPCIARYCMRRHSFSLSLCGAGLTSSGCGGESCDGACLTSSSFASVS
mmetsp:Transcript_14935/g.40978  ORF Transcript_14935/g.40978 Transcript_14935/m.40978 type:complete len:209 (+) Transcript_14935:716-1342(+)